MPGPPRATPEAGKDDPDREDRRGHLGFVAHEVRNPLSTALWTAEMLVRMTPEERGGARGEKLSAMCLRSLGRVRALVEDHLAIERYDAGGLPVRPEPLLVDEAVAAVLARGGGSASVSGDLDVPVASDRMLLDRVLEATLRAAGRDSAEVRIEVRADGPQVRIVVTGAPAAPDALDDPRKGAPSDPKGSALGLAASRRMAAANGGSLAVEGAAFVLTVPRSDVYPAAPDRSGR
jgi:signal transduction histidine kinase